MANFVAFQVGWFACVGARARGQDAWGLLIVLVILALHVWFVHARVGARAARFELVFLASAVPLGLCVDNVLHASGALLDAGPSIAPWAAPLWYLPLWPLFASTINGCTSWMRERTLLAALFGAVGAPLSYWAGARMGAVTLPAHAPTWIVKVAVTWAVALAALTFIARRLHARSGRDAA